MDPLRPISHTHSLSLFRFAARELLGAHGVGRDKERSWSSDTVSVKSGGEDG
jgi:hypothetical protein